MDKKKPAIPLVCHGHSRPVVDLFYSPITPDGIFLISASKDYTPMLRHGETGDWIGTFEGHKGAVWSCSLDSNALRAASASADFSAHPGIIISVLCICCVEHVFFLYLNRTPESDGLKNVLKFLISSERASIKKLWDALTGDKLHSFEHKHIVRACSFSGDTHRLLTGGYEKILRIFDLNRPEEPSRLIENSPGAIKAVTWLHNDNSILSSCTDIGGMRLWDVRSGKTVQTLETKSPITSCEVSKDGRYITTADGSSIKFWDANNFALLKSYDMTCKVESASLEPTLGNMFIAGGEDMWIHVYDFHSGEEIGCRKGHHGPVHCVRFAPDGESYASGSEDGTIRIWQKIYEKQDGTEALVSVNVIPSVKVDVSADEVSDKIDNLNISNDGEKVDSDKPANVVL